MPDIEVLDVLDIFGFKYEPLTYNFWASLWEIFILRIFPASPGMGPCTRKRLSLLLG
jgi:hypothetical protein